MVRFLGGRVAEAHAQLFYKNELDLTGDLLRVFNTGDLKVALNKLVARGMEELRSHMGYAEAEQKALDDETKLTLWTRFTRSHVGLVQACNVARTGGLDASDCSDLIRLMGTIIEKWDQKKSIWARGEMEEKEKRRLPAPLPKEEEHVGWGSPLIAKVGSEKDKGRVSEGHRQEMVWGDHKEKDGNIRHPGFQDVQGLAGGVYEKVGPASHGQKQGDTWVDTTKKTPVLDEKGRPTGEYIREEYQGRMRADVSPLDILTKLGPYESLMPFAVSRGLLLKEAKPSFLYKGKTLESVVGKMERVFGYPVMGADISGTTADSTYVVERFGPTVGEHFDPVMYLLPFATIVAGGHHHLLEVAGTLTLYGVIDYTIGVYETLLPIPGTRSIEKSRFKKAVQEIKSYLAAATRACPNHMLVYWPEQGGSKPLGAVVGLPPEEWKKVAQLAPAGGASLWDLFLRISPNPSLPDIRDLMRNRNCKLENWLEVQKEIDRTTPKKPMVLPLRARAAGKF